MSAVGSILLSWYFDGRARRLDPSDDIQSVVGGEAPLADQALISAEAYGRAASGRGPLAGAGMTDIMAGIRDTRWAPPFAFVDRIVHMDRESAVALTVFGGDDDRFTYGGRASPSLLVECMAQLSLALIRHSDPAVEIGIIPSLRDIAMSPLPEQRFQAAIRVRWAAGVFPRYEFAGAAFVLNRIACEATLDILARREGE